MKATRKMATVRFEIVDVAPEISKETRSGDPVPVGPTSFAVYLGEALEIPQSGNPWEGYWVVGLEVLAVDTVTTFEWDETEWTEE